MIGPILYLATLVAQTDYSFELCPHDIDSQMRWGLPGEKSVVYTEESLSHQSGFSTHA